MRAHATTPSAKFSEAEWKMRIDLAAAYRLVDMFGWSDLTGNHISARLPGPEDHFLLNPYGLLYDQVTASNLVKIDKEGNIIGDATYDVNRTGFVTHSQIHMARPEIACVLHSHADEIVAVAMQQDGLLPLTQHAMQVYGDIAYHGYEIFADSTSAESRSAIIRSIGDKMVLIQRNHGVSTLGRSIGEAWVLMYRTAMACRQQLQFQAAGVPAYPIPDAVRERGVKRAVEVRAKKNGATFEWPALLKKLDALDPSYKT